MAKITFDLTPQDKKSNIFEVTFDYFTPRSHFIISPHDNDKSDYTDFSPEKKTELIRVASAIVSEYKLKKLATLSVHRGSWYSNKYNFHAHVCADVDKYIKVFQNSKEQKQIPDMSQYVKSWYWIKNANKDEYENYVRCYSPKTYFKEDIEAIKQLSSKDKDKGKPSDSASSDTYKGFTVLYHSNEPRVGFAAENKFSEDDHLKVLDAMNNYAGENNLTDIKSKVDGCHLCVVFDDLKHGDRVFKKGERSTMKWKEKMDVEAISMASEKLLIDLGLEAKGDILALQSFAKRNELANQEYEERKRKLIDELKKGRNKGNKQKVSETSTEVKIKTRKISLGWMHWNTENLSHKYITVRNGNGGGPRNIDMPLNCSKTDIIEEAKPLFCKVTLTSTS